MDTAVLDQLISEERAAPRRDPTLSLFLDAAAWLRDDARRAWSGREAVGGAFLEAEAPAAPEPGAFERTMARIDAEAAQETRLRAIHAAARELTEILDLPPPVRDAALAALEAGDWETARPDVRRLALPAHQDARLTLWRFEPGASAPPLDHAGREVVLVLSGAWRDAAGRHGPGAVAFSPRLKPAPSAEPDGVCFLLTLTRAPTGDAVRAMLDRSLKR